MSTSETDSSWVEKLSDDVLLSILKYLDHADLIEVRKVSLRFNAISKDRELVRQILFPCCYKLTSQLLHKYLQPVTQHVEFLDLNHCYWLSSKCFDVIGQCTGLVTLKILHCKITPRRLCELLALLNKLQTVAFSIKDMRDLHTALTECAGAQKTLEGLRNVTIHFRNQVEYSDTMSMHFVARPSIFEYCRALEEFHVLGFPSNSKGIPQYILQPKVNDLENLKHIHCLSISDAIDPVARMFFFATLLEVCKLPEVRFHTLLQPMATLEHLQTKPQFVETLHRIEQLKLLDISQTVQAVPNEVFQLNRAVSLQYLNVADNSKVDSRSLHVIADTCPRLVSINLRHCHNIMLSPVKDGEELRTVDASGLQSLLLNCSELRHINVSGIHIHAEDLADSGFSSICHLLAINPNWQSLALSPCCLCARKVEEILTTTKTTGGKRVLVMYSQDQGNKRRRIGVQAPDLNMTPEQELGNELGKLVSACPDVQHFELIGAGFRSACNKRFGVRPSTFNYLNCAYSSAVREQEILCIRHWKKLQHLQLSGIPGIHGGQCLTAIIRDCHQLQHLVISHLGLTAHCQYRAGLLNALPHAKDLRDLRLEQSGLHLNQVFWATLGKIKTLERLCILNKGGNFEYDAVLRYVRNVPSLVVLQLFTSDPLNACSSMQTHLAQTHLQKRPALSLCIFPLEHYELHKATSSIPDIHLEELTILGSSVCQRPPGWDRTPVFR
ncbi:hypothetical protein BaRGS_00015557 [Batillaria attramentaria]|uniref:F-box domain-containing protein n=1 Tax=Batillaria attramentaria TaxID=370345 RepID=A0ABD0L194_9CAEN